jgi:hypothetical protein
VTAAIPIIYDGQPEPSFSPQDRPRTRIEQQEQQQQATRARPPVVERAQATRARPPVVERAKRDETPLTSGDAPC